jgi:hypothetical protein
MINLAGGSDALARVAPVGASECRRRYDRPGFVRVGAGRIALAPVINANFPLPLAGWDCDEYGIFTPALCAHVRLRPAALQL